MDVDGIDARMDGMNIVSPCGVMRPPRAHIKEQSPRREFIGPRKREV